MRTQTEQIRADLMSIATSHGDHSAHEGKNMNVTIMAPAPGAEHLSCMLDDGALVLAAQAGDQSAFSELWNRHSGMILRKLMRITNTREDAEDALQETFLKAFVHLGNFEARAKFSTWLTRIAINSGLMMLRRQRSRPTISIDSQLEGEAWKHWDVEDRTLDIEGSVIRTEYGAIIASAVSRLGPKLSIVTRHHLLNDCSVAETAASHGLTVGATKTRLLRARKALRSSLARHK
jgi:RNA polymerase sigma factor (sigma-70 family)